jgi:hypothetical protein
MKFLKADTSVKVVIGPAVSPSDGVTPVTNLTLSGADEAEIMKHDASAVTDISGRTFAAITNADGYYNLTLTTGDTDTEGMLTVLINDDNLVLPLRHDFMVVAANVFDAFFAAAGTDLLQVDMQEIDGVAAAAANLALSGQQVIPGTVGSGPTSTVIPSNLSIAQDDVLINRVLILTSGTRAYEAARITDYDGTTKDITVEQMSGAPAQNDSFIIV